MATQDLSQRPGATGRLPDGATAASQYRYDIARHLAEACPSALGEEIAVTGSIALGVADDASDVELNLWTDVLPSVEERRAWIDRIGARRRRSRLSRGATDRSMPPFASTACGSRRGG